MEKELLKFERRRQAMIEEQLESRGITDIYTLSAFQKVPRQYFVPDPLIEQAYTDYALPIGEGQTISQPFIVAKMTQALALTGKERVLEIGTGSGYQAAILSQIAYRVYTIERIRSLYIQARKTFDTLGYYNIATKYSDGTKGWPDEAPFDVIMVTAGGPKVPMPLVDQLTIGGLLVVPVGDKEKQELILVVKKNNGEIKQYNLGDCRFVDLIGQYGWNDEDTQTAI